MDEIYAYERSDGRLTLASHDSLLERKARYRQRHRALLAEKQRLYRQRIAQEKTMIKHGKIYSFHGRHGPRSHLEPIKEFVTKGIADAKEKLVLHPQLCDVKGAKKFNAQQCVIAKCLTREKHPQAVAIGRTLAYAVFDGLAIRFTLPKASRTLVDEFDIHGRVRKAPIELCAMTPSWRVGERAKRKFTKTDRPKTVKRARAKKYGVRAIGGGVTA